MYLGRLPIDLVEKTLQRRTIQPRRSDRLIPPLYQRALDYPLRSLVGNAPAKWQHIEPEEVKRAKSLPALVGKGAPDDDCTTQ